MTNFSEFSDPDFEEGWSPAYATSTQPAPEIVLTPDSGPQLIYTSYDPKDGTATLVPVDRTAVDNPRERALCRALLLHALALLDASEPTRPNGSAR